MSRPDASNRLDNSHPQPVAERRTRDRPPVGRWWWFQVGVICVLICCVVALMIVVLIPPLITNPGHLSTFIGYTPSTGAQSLLTGATLGGTLAGFDAAYGAPLHTSGVGARWESATIAGQRVSLYITLAAGQDGALHVTSAEASPIGSGATWDRPTAFTLIAKLFPKDFQPLNPQTSDLQSLTRVYTSAQLGATLLPAQFASGGGAPVATGEFNVVCQLASSGQISYCFLVAGAP